MKIYCPVHVYTKQYASEYCISVSESQEDCRRQSFSCAFPALQMLNERHESNYRFGQTAIFTVSYNNTYINKVRLSYLAFGSGKESSNVGYSAPPMSHKNLSQVVHEGKANARYLFCDSLNLFLKCCTQEGQHNTQTPSIFRSGEQ